MVVRGNCHEEIWQKTPKSAKSINLLTIVILQEFRYFKGSVKETVVSAVFMFDLPDL